MAASDFSSIYDPSSPLGSSSFSQYINSPNFWRNNPFSTTIGDAQSGSSSYSATGGAVPSIYPSVDASIEWQQRSLPIYQTALQQANQAQLDYNRAAMQQAYPFISQAAAEATQRNLAASQTFARFKEQLPSNVQNIMASKQSQIASAAGAEAQRQTATATQQDAATRFARSYAGKTFQTS